MKSITNLDLYVAGLNMPVMVQSALVPSRPPFELVDARDLNKIKMPKVNSFTGELVPSDKICKSFMVNGSRLPVPAYVLADCAPEKSSSIAFSKFVEAYCIPLFYVDSFYNLIPMKGYEENYALVQAALNRKFLAAITQATFMNCSSVLCLVPYEDCIRMYKLRFDSQFAPVEPFEKPVVDLNTPVSETLLETLESNVSIFDLSEYQDHFTANFEKWLATIAN